MVKNGGQKRLFTRDSGPGFLVVQGHVPNGNGKLRPITYCVGATACFCCNHHAGNSLETEAVCGCVRCEKTGRSKATIELVDHSMFLGVWWFKCS
jgi:hypothetical protein